MTEIFENPNSIMKRPLIFVISAPSGTGKSTVADRLEMDLKNLLKRARSCTTRTIRHGEVEGRDYYFIDEERFRALIDSSSFLEYEELFGACYGILKSEVEGILASGNHVLLVLDVKGALKFRNLFPSSVVTIFLLPPSPEEQLKRLSKRGSENSDSLHERLSRTVEEERMSDFFDYKVINQDLNATAFILKSIFIAEEHRRRDHE
ncbi:MAG: guanylate kinase [Victivallaceae bacterium]